MQIVIDALTDPYFDLPVIPAYIVLSSGEKIKVTQGFDFKKFYEGMRNLWLEGKLKTSQPSLKDAAEVLRIVNDNDILVIATGKQFTGIYNTVRNACKFVKGKKIIVYDSGTISIGAGLLVKTLLEKLEKETLTVKEAVSFLDDLRVKVEFVVENLTYLLNSGRLSLSKYLLLQLVGKKPLLGFNRYKPIKLIRLVSNIKLSCNGENCLLGKTVKNGEGILINPVVAVHLGPAMVKATLETNQP